MGPRSVINLHPFVEWEYFKMEGIHLIEHLIQKGDWMAKLDHRYVYFAVLINHDHQKWL